MMVIVVDVNLVALPLPVAAAVEIIRGYHPVGIVVQHHAARAVIDSTSDEDTAYVLVAAEGIRAARTDAVVIIVPIAVVLADLVLLPALMLAVVMAAFLTALPLVPSFVFSIIMMFLPVAMLIAVFGSERHG